MFQRVLIANRGEIALRVIRACRELGIATVAVYSDADAAMPHVAAADTAVRIGPAPPAESYLSFEALLDAARTTGADAIHPGYGFLSENPRFARACADVGITFIGPPADVIDRMGDKIHARQVAADAGVPVVPGAAPGDQSAETLAAAAATLGYPILVKPSAGGGGIGMKRVTGPEQIVEAVAQARREAQAAFGDGTVYLERWLPAPRHVEFQIVADNHGAVVHLFERECSLQRRHQKIIEESPSPALSPALRTRMGAAAVALARAAAYRNAGTVEFLVDGSGDDARFYFLEMNTRLQVEHPVTEQVVGVDLVRAQLLVAAGEPLPWRQDELRQRGHAFEARICAEDPARGDLPQAGPLLVYREPSGPGIRLDSGVAEGVDVPVHYDSLLTKLVVTAESRDLARRRAIAALESFPILGIRTNIPLLLALLRHPRVVSGALDIRLLDDDGPALRARLAAPPDAELDNAVADVARAALEVPAPLGPDTTGACGDPWADLRGRRV